MTDKAKLAFIMIGVSGCGKSTVLKHFAAKMAQECNDIRVFSLDTCRLDFAAQELGEATYAQAFELGITRKQEFDAFVTAAWNKALKGDCLFADNTNLTRKGRARWCTEARKKGFTIWGVQVMAPLQVVLDRQSTRGDKSVPLGIVKDMYMRQQEVLVGDETDFLFVVDGTIPDPIMHASIHLV